MKELSTTEVDDGREDFIMTENGIPLLFIAEELYKPYGVTYEQMKDPAERWKFLASFGLAMALKVKDNK